MLLALLIGCPAFTAIEGDSPCLEVGYALAYVAETCSGSRDAGNARYEQFVDEYTCIDSSVAVEQGYAPEDLYDCAFAISSLPCEVTEEYGDDLSLYMDISPGCALVVEERP